MDVGTRRASVADARVLAEVARSAYLPYVEQIGVRPAPLDADYGAVLADPSHEVWVADLDGEVIGLLVLVARPGHLLVENVAVSPVAQGAGVGTVLLDLAEQRARELDVTELRLFTHQRMTRNLAMYAARGYVETSREVDEGFDRVFLSKHLGTGRDPGQDPTS